MIIDPSVIRQVSREKDIDPEKMFGALEEAMSSAARKYYHDKAVITADGRLRGWIGGSCSEPIVRREALRALSEGVPQMVRIVPAPEVKQTRKRGELMVATTCPSGGALDIFIEPRLPRPLLMVFGDSPAAHTYRARTVNKTPRSAGKSM